jgi:hypothetical protein
MTYTHILFILTYFHMYWRFIVLQTQNANMVKI